MGKVLRPFVKIVASVAGAAIGFLIGGPIGAVIGATLFSTGAGLILGKPGGPRRAAAAQQLQLGEQPRQAIFGRSAVGGSLVDAFNYGGKYNTDWEVLVLALADHRCDALEGFFVDDTYVAFAGDGTVSGFNSQLQVFWRSGTWDQTVPSILTSNGPGWTANDRGRGVAYVVVAYKADKSDAKNPVWPSGRPRFRWVVRGLRCYDPRLDSTVGGSGAHRRNNPATWAWSENPIVIRHNWVRGIYAGDLVDQPGMLLIGRGLSAIEAPPANVFARANLCDELVSGQRRYRIGGVVGSTEPFIDVESDFAAACAGVISQPEGSVEVDPGQAKAPIAHFTDGDLLVGSKVRWSDFLGQQDEGWVNTVVARFVDPGQRWNVRSAPVRRDIADVVADGGPREQQPQLDLVTNAPQAQRVAEIIRRLGRLWGRAQVTLPPRFAFIEEGDWVTWQSDRRFGGDTYTFRVEAWASNRAWHHQLTLRQISASVYSDTAPLDDGVIANTQPPPPVVAAPDEGIWVAAAVLLGSGSVRVPALRIGGVTDDPAAEFVVFEYVQQVAAPDGATIWTFAASSRPDVTLFDIPVPEGGTFWVAVSYVVDGIQGERRVLGPLSTSGLAFGDGSPVSPVAPADANRVPFSRFEGNRGWASGGDVTGTIASAVFLGRFFIQTDVVFTASGQLTFLFNSPRIPVRAGERLSVASRIDAFPLSGPSPAFWTLYFEYYDSAGAIVGNTQIANGIGNSPSAVFSAAPLSAFATVPAGVQTAILVLAVQSSGAGTMRVAILEPMIATAAAGQTVHPDYTPGPNADDGADVTAIAQRTIVPQFPVVEIKQGEPGHTGTRTVTHTARRGTETLTGGTWSMVSTNLGTGAPAPSATVNSVTGTVSLNNIIMSGAYSLRYTHTDGIATDLAVNLTYVPTPAGGTVSAKTATASSSSGVGNTNAWSIVCQLVTSGVPAGRLFFNQAFGLSNSGGNQIRPTAGTGTASHQARLLINGVVVATTGPQSTVSGGAVGVPDFSDLFADAHPVTAGNLTVTVELQRTSGTGTILTMNNKLDINVIAS